MLHFTHYTNLITIRIALCRYDFHRGVDIPTEDGTPLYAIDDGKVKIAGYHINYSDGTISVSGKKIIYK